MSDDSSSSSGGREIVSVPVRLAAVGTAVVARKIAVDLQPMPDDGEVGQVVAVLYLDNGTGQRAAVYVTRQDFKDMLQALNDFDEEFAAAHARGST